ncbi:MAG: hypothetical protein ACOC2U_02535 [bacterium]
MSKDNKRDKGNEGKNNEENEIEEIANQGYFLSDISNELTSNKEKQNKASEQQNKVNEFNKTLSRTIIDQYKKRIEKKSQEQPYSLITESQRLENAVQKGNLKKLPFLRIVYSFVFDNPYNAQSQLRHNITIGEPSFIINIKSYLSNAIKSLNNSLKMYSSGLKDAIGSRMFESEIILPNDDEWVKVDRIYIKNPVNSAPIKFTDYLSQKQQDIDGIIDSFTYHQDSIQQGKTDNFMHEFTQTMYEYVKFTKDIDTLKKEYYGFDLQNFFQTQSSFRNSSLKMVINLMQNTNFDQYFKQYSENIYKLEPL